MPVLFLLRGPDKREIRRGRADRRSAPAGERTAGPLPRAVLSGGKRGNTAPKLSKFRILAVNLPLRDDLFAIFYDILSVCTRL